MKNPPKLSQLCINALDFRRLRIIGDNLDFYKRVRDMRQDHQNLSIHWFHLYAVQDRVPCCHLEDGRSKKSLMSLTSDSFLPTSNELSEIRNCMGILISRVLVEHMAAFQGMSSLLTWHIPHKHSKEMREKSIQVQFTILSLLLI